ncbi:HhoA/HhoB/HtrA family serine endopeptidase [Iningainema tapete]|uniref:Trypsin-like peptidase domain-containing protein n=1 Tax=Iningainema tapete BLCC-T55 TaxID=2748662 RepID=A0A8J6XNE9_9CYAN|nr:HhoA/HhoB/HtrA family serine endopeptidase [Iningainema tapete]MBD2775135.1 trypsin-like peptidase domain-containing protein [Iningainema tapete BLCC-T55]
MYAKNNSCFYLQQKTQEIRAIVGKRWLQKLSTCMLVMFVSVTYALFSGSTTASALPSPLLAQVDLESNFVTEAVDKTESAVVQVTVSRTIGGDVPDFIRPFFGGIQSVPPTAPVVQGLGSGFVIDSAGHILTNAHVVDDADTVAVSFQDGRILQGQVLGKDPVTDVAVIQVQAENLPTVALGDSDKVRQGQWAIAIGNPLGLQETVTVGVISGTERSSATIGIPDKRVGFIQTDAAINPGNSGGPLLNAKGEVIGINTAIIRGTQGLGFAIPINTARAIAQQLISTGKVDHPYIGVQMLALNPQIQQQINNTPNSGIRVEEDQGILVVQVGKNSPAAKAGLRTGDVIQAINNQPVTKPSTVQQLLDKAGIGGKLEMEVLRKGRTVTLTLEPEQLPTIQTR